MNSKKYKTKNKTNRNNLKTKNPNDYYQLKTIKYTTLKIQETNIVHNTKTNQPHHKKLKLILKPTHKILIKKINTTPNNTPIKTRILNIQTKTKIQLITKHAKSNNLTKNTTIRKNTKYHQKKTLYTPWTTRLFTPLTNNKTGSAYRPRHKINIKYQFTNNWLPNKITTHIPKNNNNTHFSIKQTTNTIPALLNLFTTTKFTITKYQKLNKRKPKVRQLHGYYFINRLTLLQCEDIEPNLGPMPDILRTHPAIHKKKAKTYFIPNTIKLQPEYQHIASTFAPILKPNHPLHHQTTTIYPHLHQYTQAQNLSPPTHILYVLIITINPSIDTCNNILAQPHIYHFNDIWTNTLIIRLANLNNPPERHILTQHPYTTFVENNQNLIKFKDSIHTELYEFIHNQ